MGTLFGTDGVREIANSRLTPELAFRLGRGGAASLGARSSHRPVVVVGGDTRQSTGMLEAAVTAGANSAGADVVRLGVIPTPAVAYIVRSIRADAGIVISASHNPAEYNGIKFFGPDGFKLPDEVEDDIESAVMSGRVAGSHSLARWAEDDGLPRPVAAGIGASREMLDATDLYVEHCLRTARSRLDGMRIVLDCANGASHRTSPKALRALGARVTVINDSPDGVNINDRCGSTHPEDLSRAVVAIGADMGFAHDGDADRVMACDESGNIVDGDQIMAMCALDRAGRGALPGSAIVATAYSNLGLTQALKSAGCQVLIAKAGDRYVLEEMKALGLELGGEQSGHVIFLDKTTTGDGLVTAIEVAGLAADTGKRLSELAGAMVKYPQVMVNVRVSRKDDYPSSDKIRLAVERASAAMADRGRIVVRPSGTEPLIRVMGEGPDEAEVRAIVEDVAGVVGSELA